MLALTAIGSAQPQTDRREALLTTGTFHQGEVPDNSQGNWTALICDAKQSCSAKSVFVSASKVHDEVVDEDSTAETGTEIAVNGAHGVVALVRGVNIHEGPVITYFYGESNLESGSALKVSAQGVDYQLKVEGPRKSNEQPLPKGSKLLLNSGGRSQELFGLPDGGNDPSIKVVWIGDLDGDGIPDFLINASDHYNVSNLVLYLSTRAKSNEVVGAVAHFTTVGC